MNKGRDEISSTKESDARHVRDVCRNTICVAIDADAMVTDPDRYIMFILSADTICITIDPHIHIILILSVNTVYLATDPDRYIIFLDERVAGSTV